MLLLLLLARMRGIDSECGVRFGRVVARGRSGGLGGGRLLLLLLKLVVLLMLLVLLQLQEILWREGREQKPTSNRLNQ